MASEDLFSEEFTEEIENINELDDIEIDDDNDIDLFDQNVEDEIELVKENEDAEEARIESIPVTNLNSDKQQSEKVKQERKLVQLPLSRIRGLMKLDPDLQMTSNEAIFTVAKATEMFIESLAKEAYTYTKQSKKKTIQKRDVEMTFVGVDSLMFLEGSMNFD